MSVFFAGTSIGDFSQALLASSVTTAGNIGPFCNEGLGLNLPGGVAIAPFPSAQTEFWSSFYAYNAVVAIQMFEIRNGNTPLFRYSLSVGSSTIDAWNGSAWVVWAQTNGSGNGNTVQAGNRTKVSFYLKMHSTAGVFRLWLDSLLVLEFVGNTILTAATSVDNLALRATSPTITNTTSYSAVILANEDTRDLVFDQNQFGSNGANTAWTNDYLNVTKLALSDLTIISSATANQVETYHPVAIDSSISGFAIKALVVSARARKGDSGPQNLQIVARSSSTDYTTATMALDSSFGVKQGIFSVNPATGLPWTIAEVNAAEFGVKSIT